MVALLLGMLTFAIVCIHVNTLTSNECSPALTVEYREPDEIDFLPKFAFTEDDLKRGFPDYPIDTGPLARVLRKLATPNALVRVGVFGGSFARGIGCYSPKYNGRHVFQRLLCSWSHRLVRWLMVAYPYSNSSIIPYTLGSTTSIYGLNLVEGEAVQENFDMILIDYSLNDAYSLKDMDSVVSDQYTTMLATTERIIRAIQAYKPDTPNGIPFASPAILYVSEFLPGPYLEELYTKVCRAYGVPHLRYRRAVLPYLNTTISSANDTIHFWSSDLSEFHPGVGAHQHITDLFVAYLTLQASQLCTEDTSISASRSDSNFSGIAAPPVFYTEDVHASHRCPSSQLYSLIEEDLARPGVRLLSQHIHRIAAGWSIKVDIPGKPRGWIAEGYSLSTSEMRLLHPPHLVFFIALVKGSVTVNYLQTYRNAGKFEAWISRVDNFASNGGFQNHKDSSSPHVLIRSHNKTRATDKHQSYLQATFSGPVINVHDYFTHSGHVDTYKRERNVSEIASKTFHFAFSGEAFLHIRPVPLSEQEFEIRGGDKVKLLSVRIC